MLIFKNINGLLNTVLPRIQCLLLYDKENAIASCSSQISMIIGFSFFNNVKSLKDKFSHVFLATAFRLQLYSSTWPNETQSSSKYHATLCKLH